MNVIISNLNKSVFNDLEIDVIKSIHGEFDAEEIVRSFSNFFFSRMLLDITAIRDYKNLSNIQKISIGLDADKIILILNNDPIVNSNRFISGLVNMGIYNFAHNYDELLYLYDNPNSYKDVAHYQKVEVDDPILDEFSHEFISDDVKIIGVKNFTESAGATSLIHMFKKTLSQYYSVLAIEVNKKDFLFFGDKTMISVNARSLISTVNDNQDFNIILIDLNNLDSSIANSVCTDILYLVEPSLFKINKLIILNRNAFDKIYKEKIVLNKSFLSAREIKEFEFEGNIRTFYNIPALNDRVDNSKVLMPLFEKLELFTKN